MLVLGERLWKRERQKQDKSVWIWLFTGNGLFQKRHHTKLLGVYLKILLCLLKQKGTSLLTKFSLDFCLLQTFPVDSMIFFIFCQIKGTVF